MRAKQSFAFYDSENASGFAMSPKSSELDMLSDGVAKKEDEVKQLMSDCLGISVWTFVLQQTPH